MDRKNNTVQWYAAVPATLAALAVAVPWLMTWSPGMAFALQRGFALVCHQQADRSFLLFGGNVAVCARCLGIYLGAAVGLLLRVPRLIARRSLIAAVAINTLDWLAEIAGVHGNWMLGRFALGFALGAMAAMLVIARTERDDIHSQAEAA